MPKIKTRSICYQCEAVESRSVPNPDDLDAPYIVEKVELLSCAACRVAKYCSRACQRIHWPIHKGSCTKFSRDYLKATQRHYRRLSRDVNLYAIALTVKRLFGSNDNNMVPCIEYDPNDGETQVHLHSVRETLVRPQSEIDMTIFEFAICGDDAFRKGMSLRLMHHGGVKDIRSEYRNLKMYVAWKRLEWLVSRATSAGMFIDSDNICASRICHLRITTPSGRTRLSDHFDLVALADHKVPVPPGNLYAPDYTRPVIYKTGTEDKWYPMAISRMVLSARKIYRDCFIEIKRRYLPLRDYPDGHVRNFVKT